MSTKLHSYYYLATPYTKYSNGVTAAVRLAVEQAGFLLHAGIPVFCPIAHGEPIKHAYGLDDEFPWLECDKPLVQKARGLIVCCAETWKESYGISKEIEWAKELHKSIYYMNPLDQSDIVLHICTFFPRIGDEMACRRRAALSATFAYKNNLLSLEEWKQRILAGKIHKSLTESIVNLLDDIPLEAEAV